MSVSSVTFWWPAGDRLVTGWNCTVGLVCFTTCCSRESSPVDLLLLVTSLTFWRLIRHWSTCFRNLRDLYTASSDTIPVTTCAAERSFSGLRRLKTYLRSTLSQVRLNSTALHASLPSRLRRQDRRRIRWIYQQMHCSSKYVWYQYQITDTVVVYLCANFICIFTWCSMLFGN